jgi:hypothetical protein
MSVKIKDNTSNVKKGILIKANIFLRSFADDVVRISTPNTPRDTSRLRSDVLRQVLGLKGKIVWQKKYAGIQEVKQFVNYTTPGTGPHYAENAIKDAVKRTSVTARKAGLLT